MTNVLLRDRRRDRHREKKRKRTEGHVKMETQIGMMQPQAEECVQLPKAGRGE